MVREFVADRPAIELPVITEENPGATGTDEQIQYKPAENYPLRQPQRIEKVVSLSAGDTVTIYGLLNVGSGTCEALGQDKGTNFYGYKLIGA